MDALLKQSAPMKNWHLCSLHFLYYLQAKVRETMEKAFWDIVTESLTKEPPEHSYMIELVKEIRDELCGMVPKSWKERILDNIDLDILSQVRKFSPVKTFRRNSLLFITVVVYSILSFLKSYFCFVSVSAYLLNLSIFSYPVVFFLSILWALKLLVIIVCFLLHI